MDVFSLMLKQRFCLNVSEKLHRLCFSKKFSSSIFCLRRMNEKLQSSSGQKADPESTVYIISRIEGLSEAMKSLSKKFCPSLSIADIQVFSTSNEILELDPFYKLRSAVIALCDPAILAENYKRMPNLKWAHSTWAGVEPLFREMKEKPDFIITRHAHEDFSEQMAEYILGQLLILEKNFRNVWIAEAEKSWSKMKSFSKIAWNRPIKGLTLGILGVGNMGQAIARYFKALGSTVIGFSRQERTPFEYGYFDRIESSICCVLANSDYIINTLPSTPETAGLLDENMLQVCMKEPVFINLGRGDIISESTILEALKNSWIRHAVLDVLPEEPLPSESLLWNNKKITITPHCAAESLPDNVAKDFLESFLCYQAKTPLKNVVDWERGY